MSPLCFRCLWFHHPGSCHSPSDCRSSSLRLFFFPPPFLLTLLFPLVLLFLLLFPLVLLFLLICLTLFPLLLLLRALPLCLLPFPPCFFSFWVFICVWCPQALIPPFLLELSWLAAGYWNVAGFAGLWHWRTRAPRAFWGWWRKVQRHIVAILHLNCEPKQARLFHSARTGKQAWDILASRFASNSAPNVMRLEESFGTARQGDDQSSWSVVWKVKEFLVSCQDPGCWHGERALGVKNEDVYSLVWHWENFNWKNFYCWHHRPSHLEFSRWHKEYWKTCQDNVAHANCKCQDLRRRHQNRVIDCTR